MAGQLARAYLRTGKPVLDNIVNIFNDMAEKQRQRDALTNAMNLAKQFQGKIGDISNASTTQYQPTETQTSPNLFPDQPDVVGSLLNKSVGIQPQTDFNMLGKQVTTPLPQVEKYNQGQNVVGDFLMELMKTPDISSVNPNVLNTLQAYIRQRADQLKPDVTEWRNLPQGSELAGFSTRTGQPTGQKITGQLKPNIKTIQHLRADKDMPGYGIKQGEQYMESYDENDPNAPHTYRPQYTKPDKPDYAGANYNLHSKEYADKQTEKLVELQSTSESLDSVLKENFKPDKTGYTPIRTRILDETGKERNYTKSQIQSYKNKVDAKINAMTKNSAIKQTQKTTPENKFVEGKIYVDGNGNKAKYVNGQWEEIK